MNRFTEPAQQELIVHSTKMFYRLYKGVFDSVLRGKQDDSMQDAA